MKLKKKGFTLVELLAAVVIITLLIVLTAPKVLEVVEKADKAAFENDVKTMIATAKLQYETKNPEDFYDGDNRIEDEEREGLMLPELPEYDFENGKQVNEKYKLNVKGIKLPKSGVIYVNSNPEYIEETREFLRYKEETTRVVVDGLISNNGKWCAYTEDDSDNYDLEDGEEATQPELKVDKVTDTDKCKATDHAGDSSICKVDAYTRKGRVITYEINSVCDFYALANDYKEAADLKTQYNNETDTAKKEKINKSLTKIEKKLSSYQKKGIKLMVDLDMSQTFDENAKDGDGRSISEFAMVGNAQYPFNAKFDGGVHTIKNLSLTKNQDNVGIFGVTNSYAEIYGLVLENNNIHGNSFTGGLTGRDYSSKVYEIQVNSGNVYGNGYTGGLIGWEETSANHDNIIIKDSTVNGSQYVSMVSISGQNNAIVEKGTATNRHVYNWDYSTVPGSYTFHTRVVENGGSQGGFAETDLNDINFYENAGLDTWIGGDNNESGYYWDYDATGSIVLKNIKNDPITFNLQGSGTENDPYLIKNTDDWREATTKTGTGAHYKITSDLDFENKKFYMFGSRLNQLTNVTIDGGNKYIKNVVIHARQVAYVGISGNALKSTFYGLNLKDNDITGSTYTGGLIGADDECNVYEIMVRSGTVYGDGWTGGLIGWERTSTNHNNILIKDSIVNGSQYVSMSSYNGQSSSIVEKGTATNRHVYNWDYSTVPGSYTFHTRVVENGGSQGGFAETDLNDINFYENAGMDTWIGGDNNSSGYYWDYDGDDIILKDIVHDPITFTLSGNGTKTNPYIIKTWKDWKEATSKTSVSAYYKINNDIDFENKKFYMFGSRPNQLTNVTIDGNNKYIKNAVIHARQVAYVGLSGNALESTFYGMNLMDNDFTGSTYTGSLIGYDNSCKVYEILLRSGTVYGDGWTGGMIGYETTLANHNNLLIKDVNVNGSQYVSIASYSGQSSSIVEGGVATNRHVYNWDYSTIPGGEYTFHTGVLENGNSQGGFAQSDKGDINFYENAGMDTWIGGDNDNSGYYWDYELDHNSEYYGEIILKDVEHDPITWNVRGSGTQSNPYLITNEQDWKEVSARLSTSAYYKVTNNLSFAGDNKFYMLGSRLNQMNGFNIEFMNKYIRNATINARQVAYIGISGWANNSTFYGLNLDDNNINGADQTGTLIGRDVGCTVYEIMVKGGNVLGNDNTSALIGWQSTSAGHHNILVKDIIVNGSYNVGALSYYGQTNSVIEKATVTNRHVYNYNWNATAGDYTYYTRVMEGTSEDNKSNFANYDVSDLGDINFYENAGLDTWIGGDNDNSGYYWDYENDTDKNVILKKVSDTPITFTLQGSGTQSDPYQIKTWKHWKEVSARLSTSAYYITPNDIDFTDKQFYMLGSRLNQMNAFNMEFKNKVISGAEIHARQMAFIGISGWANNSTFYGLNLDDNNINGADQTGTLIGRDVGCTVYEIMVKGGNVLGNENTSALIGWQSTSAGHHNVIVKDITVNGSYNVGALSYYGQTNSIVESATVTNRHVYNYNWNATSGDYTSYINVIENGNNNSAFIEADLGDINFYENMGLDTWIGGDNDSSGYYWDYENDNVKNVILKKVSDTPITFTLQGSGTQSDPYQIKTWKHWKEVSARLSTSAYYITPNDIDFTDKQFYMLGSRLNQMNAFNMEFKNKVISGAEIHARNVHYVGISGWANNSTFFGLNLDDNNINGADQTGTLIGRDVGCTVYEIMVKGGSVLGNENTSGLIGWQSTSAGHHNIIVKDITVNGSYNVGALAYFGETNSIVEGATVTNRHVYNYNWNATSGDYTSYINVIENSNNNSAFIEADLGDINFYENMGLDTWIGGDDDSSGYYWDYENDNVKNVILKKVTDDPITWTLAGSGTPSDPYIINSWKTWKEATSRVSTSAIYKLTSNLDFTDKQFYMFGSRVNPLTSITLNGGNKEIKGAEIHARNVHYVGISGWANESTFFGLNLDDNNINGADQTGTLIGRDVGCNVLEIMVKGGSVLGNENTSGLIGWQSTSAGHHNIIVKDITVNGSYNVGALAYFGETNSIVESATVTNRHVYNYNWNATSGDYTYSTRVIENGNPQGGFDVINLNDINFYETAGLDTWIGGDNDNTGYYWDYSGNEIILKDTATSPITFSLSGSGTESDPYIINSVADWRQASTRPTACYKLGSDIDFTEHHYYMLGSRINHFTGIFNGNAKFVSNIIINAIPVNSIGMFGYTNEARIYAINVINPRISGLNYVGAIVGEDHDSSVREIALEGGNLVASASWCSAIIGWQTGGVHNQYLIKNITVDSEGNIGAADYLGSTNTFIEYATVNNRHIYNYNWNITNGANSDYIEVRENGGTPYTSVDAYYKNNELRYNSYLETRYSGDTNGTGYMFTADPDRENKIYVTENKVFEASPSPDATDPHEGSGSTCSCTSWVLHGRTTYRTGSDRSCTGTQYGGVAQNGCYTYKLQGMGPASMSNTADGKWFCSAELLTRTCTRN